MGQPAARLSDMHICPMWSGLVPHVGGPILPACMPDVIVGGLPAARVGDLAYCNAPPDVIVQGSPTVLIGGQMAARLGDMTAHGGVIVVGDPTVLIGEGGGGGGSSDSADSETGGIMDALSNAASSVEGFVKGVGEGAWDGLSGMVQGIGHLAESGYKLVADSQYRHQTLDSAIQGAEAVGDYAAKAIADPGQAMDDIGNAASGAWNKLESGYQQAAAQGQGSEFIGKVVGQGAVLVGGALIPGAVEADAAGDAGLAAELVGDAGKAEEAAEIAGDVGDAGQAVDIVDGASLGDQAGDAVESGLFQPKLIGQTEPGAVEMTPEIQASMDAANARGAMSAAGYPDLPADAAKTFGETPIPWNGDEAPGPISRVIGSGSNPAGEYWLPTAPTTEAEWRGGVAVQNDFNGDGAMVQADPAGLRGWIGKAAPQVSSDGVHALPGDQYQIWMPSGSAQPSSAVPTPWNVGSSSP